MYADVNRDVFIVLFFPIRLIDEPAFGETPGETLEGAIFTAQFGLRQRPTAFVPKRAAD